MRSSTEILLTAAGVAANSGYRMPVFKQRSKSSVPSYRKYELCRCGSGKKYKWCCMPKDFPERKD